MASQPDDPEFESLLEFLSVSRGFDFGAYKRSTLMRRTQARLHTLDLESYGEYMDRLQVDPDEFQRFFDTILINVTAFFRDPQAWQVIAEKVIPAIIARKPVDADIRVWSAGCASGEEAYTLAILFAEALGIEQAAELVKIYATDLDESALTTARAALYSEKAVRDVPLELREKYFEKQGEVWALRRDIRRLVIFGRHDLLKDAPISRVDLVVCRNTLMYFNAEWQTKVLERFFFALREGGFLFLGKAETLLTRKREVVPLDLKLRVFEVPRGMELRSRLLVSAQNGGEQAIPDERIREKAFDLDPVAQFVIDPGQALILVNDNARRLFGIRDDDVGRPLRELEASHRPVELRPLIDRAMHERRTITMREVNWPLADATPRWIAPRAIPLVDQGGFLGVKLVFTDVTAQKELQLEIEASHAELETAYEELQSANEELETTNEELHSTIEELETTNEELQSTNEELETTNEELESANEELHTVNEVMREQSDGMDRANTYLNAILGSLGAGVIVVNRNMEVQIWNRQAEEQWGLRAEEVRGANLLSLDFGLPVDPLIPALRDCLADSNVERTEVVKAHTRRGYPVECTILCRPFHVDGNAPQGAILLIRERALKEGE